jgi:hypothetical protein
VNARAATVTLACAYLLALGVWLLAQMSLALDAGRSVAEIATHGARALLLAQTLVGVLAAPLLVAALAARAALTALLAIVIAAVPLLTFIWLTTTLSAARLFAAEAAVLTAAVATAGLAALVTRTVRDAHSRALGLALLQLGAAAGCWRLHPTVTAWLAP